MTHEEAFIRMAALFAERSHLGQTRKYTGEPYFVHPQRVAEAGRRKGLPSYAIAALYLHDVIEDCKVTRDEIVLLFPNKEFGEKVATIVDGLTNKSKKVPNTNREQRKAMDHERLSKESKEVKICKLLDRLDNISDMGGCKDDFRFKYARETLDLLKAVGDGDEELKKQISAKANEILKGGSTMKWFIGSILRGLADVTAFCMGNVMKPK